MILLKPHFKCYDFQCDGLFILIILFHVQFKYSKLSSQTDISLSKLLKSLKSMNLRNMTLLCVFHDYTFPFICFDDRHWTRIFRFMYCILIFLMLVVINLPMCNISVQDVKWNCCLTVWCYIIEQSHFELWWNNS